MDRQHGRGAAGARGLCAIGDRRLADSGRRAGRGDRAASLSLDRLAAQHRRRRAGRLRAARGIFRAEAGRAAPRSRGAGPTARTQRNRAADRVGDCRGIERVRRARASLDRTAPARGRAAAGRSRVAQQPRPAGTRPGYLAGRHRRGDPARRVPLCQHDGGADTARRARRAGRAAIPGHAVGAEDPGGRNAVRPAIAGYSRLGRRTGDRNRDRNVHPGRQSQGHAFGQRCPAHRERAGPKRPDRLWRHHRAIPGGTGAQSRREQAAGAERKPRAARRRGNGPPDADRRGVAPIAEDGGDRPAHRRRRARFQQPADNHPGQPGKPRAPSPARRQAAAPYRGGGTRRLARRRADQPPARLLATPAAGAEGHRRECAGRRNVRSAPQHARRGNQGRGGACRGAVAGLCGCKPARKRADKSGRQCSRRDAGRAAR